MNPFTSLNPYRTIARLEKELALAHQYQPLAEQVIDLNHRMLATLDQQQEELVKAQDNFARCLSDLKGWMARCELVETLYAELQQECLGSAPPASFPPLSQN